MSDLEGAILSDYLLLKCISKGGTADVYRAQQYIDGSPKGNYEVAVKVFRPGYAQRKSFRDYFMAEAEKIGQLDHPNILPFLEFGEGDGLLYSVTPFVPTGTLEDLLARVGGKLSTMQALPIMQQLSSAVQYAHDRSVIHGNMKPSNIFIAADGRVLLADFSVTRGYDDSQQSLTRIGWGSAEYSAPEQSLGVLRSASDIYTLGVLLFRLLTGRPPFTGQTPVEVLLKHVRQQAPSARMLAPHISDAVDGVLLVAMQKRSDERFASAQAFSDALAAAVMVAPITSPFAQPVASPRVPPGQLSLVETPFTPVPARAGHAWPVTPAIQWTSPSSTLGVPTNTSPTQSESGQQATGTSAPQTGNLPGRVHFLQEDDDSGPSIFEWRDSVEWSSVDNGNDLSAPQAASEYLDSVPAVPDTPTAPIRMKLEDSAMRDQSLVPDTPTAPIRMEPEEQVSLAVALPVQSMPTGTDSGESGQAQREMAVPQAGKRPAHPVVVRVKQVLPAVIVILLLLGLLVALLSSFFCPGGGTHGSSTGWVFGATYVVAVRSSRGKTWQNS